MTNFQKQPAQTGPLSVRSIIILCFCAAFMLVEGLDLAAMPLTIPRVSAQWGLPAADFSISLSIVVIGIGIAAIAIAPFGEKIGRRRMIFWSGLFTAVVTVATAYSTSVTAFTVWRFLTGLGLGACLPNITASVAQMAPDHMRARILAVVNTAIPAGSVLAGFIAVPLIKIGNWPALFLFAGILTLLVTVALRSLMPAPVPVPASTDHETARTELPPPSQSPLTELIKGRYRSITLLLLGLATTNTFLMYMVVNWLPTLLPRGGVSVDSAAQLSSIFQFGGIMGGFLFAYLMDKGHAIITFMAGYIAAALAFILLGFVPYNGVIWTILLLIAGIGISGAHVAITIFGIGFYPNYMISSFIGLSIAITRIGAISGPMAGGWLIGNSHGMSPFMLAALAPTSLCLGWIILICKINKKS